MKAHNLIFRRAPRKTVMEKVRIGVGLTLIWMLAFFFFDYLRFSATEENFSSQDAFKPVMLIAILLLSMFAGLLFTLTERVLERTRLAVRPLWFRFLVRLIIYFFGCKLLMLGALTVMDLIGARESNPLANIPMVEALRSQHYWALYAWFVVIALMLSFIREMDKQFGPGNLWIVITGRYHQPKDEERVFLFLDMKDSTPAAIELGRHRYSALIQECFYELDRLLPEFDAKIYQYVGDEAVLTWNERFIGEQASVCVDLVRAFNARLAERADEFQAEFGWTPRFKGGLHAGPVSVVEIGNRKKEIAYHGDTINTTARIQSLCNELEAEVLVSDSFLNLIDGQNRGHFESAGLHTLRGRTESLGLHRIPAH